MAPIIKDSIWLLSVKNSNCIHHMSTLFKMKLFTINGREHWQHWAHKAHAENNKTHATWKTREMNNIDPITYRWLAQVLRKAKQSLSLLWHPTCYSYGNDMIDTNIRCRRVRDRMVVGFTTTYAISAYHHWWCQFESDQDEVYNIMW